MSLNHPFHPKYNPKRWNKNKYTKKSHNCYSYALNLKKTRKAKKCKKYMNKTMKPNCNHLKPQPGKYTRLNIDFKKHDKTCKNIIQRMMKDNKYMKKTIPHKKVPYGYYKIALATIPDKSSYHFYRQDKNGLWSHKDGAGRATNKDIKGRLIHDPKKAERGKYKHFCGYFIVPISSKKKKMSSFTRKIK